MALTATDIKALKKADTICFDHFEGKSGIRAIKKTRLDDVWDADLTHTIEATAYKGDADYNHNADGHQDWNGYLHFGHANSYNHLQTLWSLLRVGDTIGLIWNANSHDSQVVSESELIADTLYLRIERNTGAVLHLLVQTTVTKDNSARTIRQGARHFAY